MTETARKRLLWGSAALVCAWAGWILLQDQDASQDLVVERTASRRAPATVQRPADMASERPAGDGAVSQTPGALAAGERLTARSEGDAFGTRNWQPPVKPAPAVVAAPAAEAVAAPVAPPPPPPPQLPYKFVGMLEGVAADKPQVFLALGDKLLVAAAGEALDGGFRLDTIRPTELVFTHVQQGLTVRMPISGAPS